MDQHDDDRDALLGSESSTDKDSEKDVDAATGTPMDSRQAAAPSTATKSGQGKQLSCLEFIRADEYS